MILKEMQSQILVLSYGEIQSKMSTEIKQV